MDRNEVLERLDAAASDRGPIVYELVHVELLRAAAELIRAGGWRPIAEAPPKLNWALCGRWNGQIWEEVESSPKECAELGWTHYFVVPAPPAREVENG
jgi:hypothetical protein